MSMVTYLCCRGSHVDFTTLYKFEANTCSNNRDVSTLSKTTNVLPFNIEFADENLKSMKMVESSLKG